MIPKNAKKEFERRIKQSGAPMGSLTPAQGIRLMLDFYHDVRADGCELDNDGDMLLFQWGTYNFGGEPSFQFDITRQLYLGELEGEGGDSAMSQLSFTFHFAPSAQLDAMKAGNHWCRTLDKLIDFEAFITGSDAEPLPQQNLRKSRLSIVEFEQSNKYITVDNQTSPFF